MEAISELNPKIIIEQKEKISCLRFTSLEGYDFLKHGFIPGKKDGSKIKSSDIPQLIAQGTGIPEEEFKVIIPRQVHQAEVKIIKEKLDDKVIIPEVDALLTDQENLFLVVQVADCLPVYLVDPEKKIIGLAHIGWRSALLGMAEKCISEALSNFSSLAENLNLVLGPSIGNCCYRVSGGLAVLMDEKYIDRKGSESYLDLNSLVVDNFLKCGVKKANFFVAGECTFCKGKFYQSYRRDKDRAGRMVAFIGKIKDFKK